MSKETQEEESKVEDVFYNDDSKSEDKEEKPEEKVDVVDDSKEEEKDTDDKTEDDTSKDKDETKEVEYKLELKKDGPLDESFIKDAVSFAKEHSLSNEAAQAILSKQEEAISLYQQAQEDAHEQQIEEWENAVSKDPQLGGENLKQVSEDSKAVLTKFGSDELNKILKDTGYGNHPEIVKMLSKVGRLMREDQLLNPEAHGEKKTAEEVFYGTNK